MSRPVETTGTVSAPILAEAVRMGRAIRDAAREAGVQPGDPMAPLVEAIARAVVFLGHQRAALAATAEGVTERLDAILAAGRETADAETARFRAECQATEAETVSSLSAALADAAAAAFTDRVRAMNRRTAAMVALSVVGALVLGVVVGWWAGDRSAHVNITATEESVRAAFREGPAAAAVWVRLMRWNDPKAAMAVCGEPSQIIIQGGRRGCWFPFWIEPLR